MSKIGAVRPLARYASPTSRMNVPGACETTTSLFGSSVPQGDVANPITFTDGR